MRDAVTAIGLFVVAIGVLTGVAFWGRWIDVTTYRIFGPQKEAARHTIFKESQAYYDGAVKHLTRLRQQYEVIGDGHKAALRATILTEASVVDEGRLPPDLRAFIERLRRAS